MILKNQNSREVHGSPGIKKEEREKSKRVTYKVTPIMAGTLSVR